jgi:hypothetical protein
MNFLDAIISVLRAIGEAVTAWIGELFAPLRQRFRRKKKKAAGAQPAQAAWQPSPQLLRLMRLAVALLAVAGLAWAVRYTIRAHRDRPPESHLNPYRALGVTVAEQVARELNQIGRIVMFTEDSRSLRSPLLQARQGMFKSTLAQHKRLLIDAEHRFAREQLSDGAVDAAAFLTAAQRYKYADAIVSFVGFPNLTPAEAKALPDSPRIIAVFVSGEQEPPLHFLTNEVIRLAVLPRSGPRKKDEKEPANLREWFEREFTVMTAGQL